MLDEIEKIKSLYYVDRRNRQIAINTNVETDGTINGRIITILAFLPSGLSAAGRCQQLNYLVTANRTMAFPDS